MAIITPALAPTTADGHRARVFQDDYILRMIDKLAAMVAELALPGRVNRAMEHELHEIEDAYGELFGIPLELLGSIDGKTLRSLVRSPEAATAVLRLLEAEASLVAANGDDARAAQRRRLADELRAIIEPSARGDAPA